MNSNFQRLLAGALLVTVCSGVYVCSAKEPASKPAETKITAKQIIAKMAKVYKTCKSYSDSGAVKTIFYDYKGNITNSSNKPFKTAFIRPDQFRFEYKCNQSFGSVKLNTKYIIWAKEKNIRYWWSIQPGIKTDKSLGMAIARATGVSGGSAHTIPNLLMKNEVSGWSITDITQQQRIADAWIDDIKCYRIQGINSTNDPITIWISQKTFLVMRIDENSQFDDFRTETTTTYKPEINIKIDKSKLAFNAPTTASK